MPDSGRIKFHASVPLHSKIHLLAFADTAELICSKSSSFTINVYCVKQWFRWSVFHIQLVCWGKKRKQKPTPLYRSLACLFCSLAKDLYIGCASSIADHMIMSLLILECSWMPHMLVPIGGQSCNDRYRSRKYWNCKSKFWEVRNITIRHFLPSYPTSTEHTHLSNNTEHGQRFK